MQLEVVVEDHHGLAAGDPELRGRQVIVETRVQRVHLAEHITADDEPDRVDPARWRPLIMSFQRFYGLTDTEVAASTLATVFEKYYRSHDMDRASR